MDSLLERLICQLDTLIPFLALSREEAFRMVRARHSEWFSEEEERSLPETYAGYRTQVTHAAFLLGYSYFEAFLSDLARDVYARLPRMLPEKKELKFSEILECSHYQDVVSRMIEKEIRAVFSGTVDTIRDHFQEKLTLEWPPNDREAVVRASLLRNCIIHNMARADARLAQVSDYGVTNPIELTVADVHSMGTMARRVARHLYHEADEKFFSNDSIGD